MTDEAFGAPACLPAARKSVNVSSTGPRKRKLAPNDIPLSDRILIDLRDGAKLMSVSYRTAKRVAADHPELTATVSRRRLFIRARLEAWLAAGAPAPKMARR